MRSLTTETEVAFETVPCPHGCVAGDDVLHDFHGFRICRCQRCELVRLNPRLSESSLKSVYAEQYFSGDHTTGYDGYERDRKLYEKTFARRLQLIRCFKSGGRLLDIGCGPGYFLDVAQHDGYEVYGLDVSPYAIEACKSRFDGRVIQGFLQSDSFEEGMFEVVTMFDVFEHVYHPVAFLSLVSAITKENGIIVITTPNQRSMLSRLSGRKWISYKIPEHVYYYTPDTLKQMAEPYFKLEHVQAAGQFCSLEFLADRLKTLNVLAGKAMMSAVNTLGIKRWAIYVNSGSMTAVLRKRSANI